MIIDILFCLTLIFACFKGITNGLVLGIFSLLGFVIGLAAALKMSVAMSAYLQKSGFNLRWLPFLSFIIVFILVCLIVKIGARIIKHALKLVMLGWLDRLGGMILYLTLYFIIFSVFIFFAVRLNIFRQESITGSVTYPFIYPWGPKVIDNFGKILPFFKDMFVDLEDFFGSVVKKSG